MLSRSHPQHEDRPAAIRRYHTGDQTQNGVLEPPGTRLALRTFDSPPVSVADDPGLFCAGAPIFAKRGLRVGTICVQVDEMIPNACR